MNIAAQSEERPAGMAEMLQNVAVVKPAPRPAITVEADPSSKLGTETSAASESSLLTRIGVQSQDSLALSLDDAIRMALENNNNIELTRDDVRFQETQIRAISGAYDPVVTVSPTWHSLFSSCTWHTVRRRRNLPYFGCRTSRSISTRRVFCILSPVTRPMICRLGMT